MDIKRVTKPSSEHLLGFLVKYKELLERKALRPEFILNVDESGAKPGPQHITKTINTVGKARSGQATPDTEPLRTVLPFVNAAGQVIMLVLIFKKAHASDHSAGKPIYFDEQLSLPIPLLVLLKPNFNKSPCK